MSSNFFELWMHSPRHASMIEVKCRKSFALLRELQLHVQRAKKNCLDVIYQQLCFTGYVVELLERSLMDPSLYHC